MSSDEFDLPDETAVLLATAAALLAEATVTPPPPPLRARTLDRARARRPAGRPLAPPAPCSPAEGFDRTALEFAALLAGLSAEDWAQPAHAEHGTVHDLVAHLVGVERLCVGWLDPERPADAGVELDHVTATRPVIDALADAAPAEVARQWVSAAQDVAAVARRGDPSRPVHFHDLLADVDGLLVMRTFELWAHGMDIALATGRPLPVLDDERMALLSGRLVAALPVALAYRGIAHRDATVRLVLTGPAGGSYDVPLGSGDGAAVTIVADVVQLCRVAARRLPAAELAVDVEGDRELAGALLRAVDAFARD